MAVSLYGNGGGGGSATAPTQQSYWSQFMKWLGWGTNNESNNMNKVINASGGKGSKATQPVTSYTSQVAKALGVNGSNESNNINTAVQAATDNQSLLEWIIIGLIGFFIVNALFKD